MEGFTSRTSGLSRQQIDSLLGVHERITATATKEYGGVIVKNLGDGYMITFNSPTNAILCAKKIQQDVAVHNAGVAKTEQFRLRIAANSGEVSFKEGDVFGEPVNVAARLMAQTDAGDIAFTESVYLAMNKTEIQVAVAGVKVLRGIPEAVKVYRVPRTGEKVTARGDKSNTFDTSMQIAKPAVLSKTGLALLSLGSAAAILYGVALKTDSLASSAIADQPEVMGTSDVNTQVTPVPTITPTKGKTSGSSSGSLTGSSTDTNTSSSGGNSSGGGSTTGLRNPGTSSSGGQTNTGAGAVGATPGNSSPTPMSTTAPAQSDTQPTPTPCEFGVNSQGNCRDEFIPIDKPKKTVDITEEDGGSGNRGGGNQQNNQN